MRFLPLADIDRIEILRGPASALYGADAVGGVIQIFTKRGAPGVRGDIYAGAGSYGAQKLAAGVSGGNEQWRFNLQGQDDRTRKISSIRNGKNRDADNDPYTNSGTSASVSFLPATGHEVTFSGMANQGQTFYDSVSGQGTVNNWIDFKNEVWNLSSKNRINDYWTSLLRFGQSMDQQVVYTTSASALRTETTSCQWQNDIKLPLGNGQFVLEQTDQDASPATRFTGVDSITTRAAQLAWNANWEKNRWQLSGRHDEHSTFGNKDTWSASYGYQFLPEWRANASAGTSFKAPTMYQLYIPVNGNAALTPETGRNRELSLVWDKGPHNASLTWYRNSLTNMIDFINSANRYRNVSSATLEGWTLAYTGKVGDWGFAGSLDLLDATDNTTNKQLSRRAKEKLNASVSRTWGDWNAGAEVISVGRRFNSEVETQPLGGYTLLNLTARYIVNKSLTIDLRANNVTDKQYTTAMTSSGLYEYTALGANYFVGLRYRLQ